jgi:hypothetical protein
MGLKKEQSLKDYVDNKIEFKNYSHAQLQDFHNKIQRFYFDQTLPNGETIRVLDRQKLMVAFGAISQRGAIILKNVRRHDSTNAILGYDRPNRLEEFENIFKQWQEWKVFTGLDKGSAQFKKLEQLDQVAAQMTVAPGPEEIPF